MIEKPIVPAYWPQQSPIDIRPALTLKAALTGCLDIQYPQKFDGSFSECDPETHECQFKPADGTVANIKFHGQTCPLVKLHFHSPSEHRIDGKPFPLEVHFVHKIPNPERGSELVVIGVFLAKGTVTSDRKGVGAFGQYLSRFNAKGKKDMPAESVEFHPYHFLPAKQKSGEYAFFRYEGSLTTQPFGESVSWIVMRDVVSVSSSDLNKIVKKADHPARETQQISRRFILRNFD